MSPLTTLSLFRLISSAPGKQMVQFNEGMLARNLFEQLELEFETTVPALATMSLNMELATLEHHATGGTIFVGFQKMSRFTNGVAQRYLKMAERQNRVFVFGLPDSLDGPTHPNLSYIPLEEEDALIQEWFVVMDTPQYRSALSALDLVGFDNTTDINERLFTGVRTRSAELTKTLASALDGALSQTLRQPISPD